MSQVINLDESNVTIKFKGEDYVLTLPTFKDLKWLREETKGKESEDMGEVYLEFFSRLGLSRDVSESLPARSIAQLATALINPEGLKKN